MAVQAPLPPISISGRLGPRVVDTTANGELLGPPPRLIDNDQTWLGFTDLVFVDPVGTGFSRATKNENDFFGVKEDTEALSEFVRLFLGKSGRMVSPVYFVGESYGGFRAANLTHALQKEGILSPSGMILISPALEFSLLNTDDYDPLAWALPLPSMAAVNLEQKGVTGRDALAARSEGRGALRAHRLSRRARLGQRARRQGGKQHHRQTDRTSARILSSSKTRASPLICS